MKASPAEQRELLTLQGIDNRIAQLTRSAQVLPQIAAIAARQKAYDDARRSYAQALGAVEDARTELARSESDVEVVEKRLARDTDRLATASSTKDVAALEQEIAALTKRRSDLEDIELTLMERIEGLDATLTEATTKRDVITAELRSLAAERDAELEVISGKRAATDRDRASLVEKVPADLLALYEKQRSRYGIGAALLRGKMSEGSGVTLTESDLAVIRRAAPDDVVLCPDSQCILVRGEESSL